MNRHAILAAVALAATALLTLPQAATSQSPPVQNPATAEAKQAKPLKDALVGTWRLLLADELEPDGTQKPLFGPNPLGTLILTASGHYSLQIMRYGRPKFAADDPAKGTAEENKAAISGIVSHFGTYTIDEPGKTLVFRVQGSAYPNWDQTLRKETITALNPNDVLTYTAAPFEPHGRPVMVAWKWAQ